MAGSYSSGSSFSQQYPVTTPQNDWQLELSRLLYDLGMQQYSWALKQYDQLSGITDDMINRYITASDKALDMAGYDLNRYRSVFQPLEDQLIAEAGSYASQPRLRANMGMAESGVMQAGEKARQAAERQLQSFGINPSSGRYADLIAAQRTATAASAAGAGTMSRLATEQVGRNLRQQALAIGQQYPGNVVNALNAAYTGVSGAENAALGRANAGVNLTTSPAAFFNPAMQVKAPGMATRSGSSQMSGGGGGGGGGDKNKPPIGGGGGGGAPVGGPAPRGGGLENHYISPLQRRDPGVKEDDENTPEGATSTVGVLPDYFNDVQAGKGPWDWMAPEVQPPTNPLPEGWGPLPGSFRPDQWPADTGGGGQQLTRSFDAGQFGQQQPPAIPDWEGFDASQWGQPPQQPQQPDWSTQFDLGDWSGYEGTDTLQGSAGEDTFAPSGPGNYGNYSSYDPYTDWGNYGSYGGYYGGYAKGGGVLPGGNNATSGGFVSRHLSPSGGRMTDDIPARLNADEFVIPRDVAMWKGQEFFQKLIQQSRQARQGAPAKPSKGAPSGR